MIEMILLTGAAIFVLQPLFSYRTLQVLLFIFPGEDLNVCSLPASDLWGLNN